MRITRAIMFGLIAAVAVSVAGSASASAAVCEPKSGEKFYVLCVGPIEPTELVSVAAGFEMQLILTEEMPALPFALTVEGGPRIGCKAAPGRAEFGAPTGPSGTEILTLAIELGTCKVTNSAETEGNCVVKEPIAFDAGAGTFSGPSPLDIALAPPTSGIFAEITIKSATGKTCLFAKEKQKVKGKQLCEGGNAEVLEPSITCEGSGSELTYAEKPAKLEIKEEVLLTGAFKEDAWKLTEGL